jgi:hypothetical protein
MADHPGYGPDKRAVDQPRSGTGGGGGDQTTMSGQYPPTADHGIFGGALPTSTGAPGTSGGKGDHQDPTVEAGQLADDFGGGVSPSDVIATGAPGSTGASGGGGGGNSVTFTDPGSYLGGTYDQDTVSDNIVGPGEWTEANDSGYGTSGPQLPALKGNQPTSTGAGQGQVMRGGRMRGGS